MLRASQVGRRRCCRGRAAHSIGHREPRLRAVGRPVAGDEPEVEHLDEVTPDTGAAQVDVRGLHVAVDQAILMCLLERFTPYVSGGRGAVRGEEAREWLKEQRNEAIAEATLIVSAIAMLAAIVAAVRS